MWLGNKTPRQGIVRGAVAMSGRPRVEPSAEPLKCAVGRPARISLGMGLCCAFSMNCSFHSTYSMVISIWLFFTFIIIKSCSCYELLPASLPLDSNFKVWFDVPIFNVEVYPVWHHKGQIFRMQYIGTHRSVLSLIWVSTAWRAWVDLLYHLFVAIVTMETQQWCLTATFLRCQQCSQWHNSDRKKQNHLPNRTRSLFCIH